jgi:hypothetical protein
MMNFFFTTKRDSFTSPATEVAGTDLLLTNSISHSQVAYITSDVLPGKGGRLHYLTTEWGARSIDNAFIAEGTLVRPVTRQGNTWIVAVDGQAPSQQVV